MCHNNFTNYRELNKRIPCSPTTTLKKHLGTISSLGSNQIKDDTKNLLTTHHFYILGNLRRGVIGIHPFTISIRSVNNYDKGQVGLSVQFVSRDARFSAPGECVKNCKTCFVHT